jgi:hypothetical protein
LFPFSRRLRFQNHTVFVRYSLSFMSLLLVTAMLVGTVAPAVPGMAILIPPIHRFRQLRRACGLGRFGELWRTIMLILFATIVAVLFVVLLVAFGLFD